ncbi:Glyoxalase superfamily enzyme, possibly 3-demethylubiquinone-9 3-methyltransferase [Sphingomonas sp. YR710]|jgi:predicted 3-demethylubiquinone-9 3-methyltransferase (glyoxalase superfamily)|uniref:VOC family protein n=1 Tax=Sphingomonas sp. YR710 TaxID=1882773 RepID=UPI000884345C|nr:VOC family protein [Sphingomonas sp. YR710]SDC12120.1 Glyoxalase superfamily enzyme, possibly 3-demethylubiquinone-9 3-methyltransferase [Sphingomonas sp. YR710]
MPDIAPCLWFDGQAEEAARFYTTVFPNSSIGTISRYGEGAPFPAGTALLVEFTLHGRPFQALNGGPHFSFSEAVSFSADCANQDEIDHYWSALIADGGTPGQCGWLKDRYGLSWQIVPDAIVRMLKAGTAEQIGRMYGALFAMTKLDIATLEAAFQGEGQ